MSDALVKRRQSVGAPFRPRPQSMATPSTDNLAASLSSLLRRSMADLRRAEVRDNQRVSLCLAAGYLALTPTRGSQSAENTPVRRRPAPAAADSARKKIWRHSYAAGALDRIGEEAPVAAGAAQDRRLARRSGVAFAPTLALSPSVLFPWRKSDASAKPPAAAAAVAATELPPGGECSQPTPHVEQNGDSKAASLPPTGLTSVGGASRRSQPAASRTSRRFKSNSSPVFAERPNRSHSAWDLGSGRPWSHYGGELSAAMSAAGSSVSVGGAPVAAGVVEEPAGVSASASRPSSEVDVAAAVAKRGESTSSPTPSASADDSAGNPLRRFRKSFSLRLSRRSSNEDAPDDCSIKDESLATDGNGSPGTAGGSSSLTGSGAESGKFRFGPLVWRASRERAKKGTKAARSAKCNSGDSGVQMESSPPSSSIGHQADEEAESLRSADSSVRRTRSDLGGDELIAQALGNWNGHLGSDSTDGSIPADSSMESSGTTHPHQYQRHVASRSRKMTRYLARTYLRRSTSQPVVVSVDSAVGIPTGSGASRPRMATVAPSNGPSSSSNEGISDSEDAGLCLSEDELSDHSARETQVTSAVNYAAASEGTLAIALWDHSAVESGELSLRSCDVLHVLDFSDADWWWAAKGSSYGWVPSSYVKLCEQPSVRSRGHDKEAVAAAAAAEAQARSSKSIRTNVIHELVTAERDYVKLLNDLVEGYLIPMRNRPDLFSAETIDAIFGNLETLYEFQKRFLVNLEHCLNWNSLEDSVVGSCFIQHRQEFQIYSTYCNNQDRAAVRMQSLYQDVRYVRFFEACRLLRRMIRLPLEAFLLSPVQKICKYPLQLAELLKHTPEEHADRPLVSVALDSMRSVAYLVNESKRRAEMQQHLISWQRGVEHWQGSDITASNTRLVRQGELFKISSTGWTRDIILFLYDKELVLCKKELMKRHSLVYKDRLSVEDCEIVDMGDGRDLHFNVSVRHAFKLRCLHRDKWFLFAARSADEKAAWLQSLRHLQQQQQHLHHLRHLHQQTDWHLLALDAPPATYHSALNFQRSRHKLAALAKRSKGKYNPAVNLTLEEAHRTLLGCDLPAKSSKSCAVK